jgi:hypothetical protein
MSNRNQQNSDPFSQLENIHPIEAPEFLLTRIRQKIQFRKNNKVQPIWAWSIATTLLLVVALNVYVVILSTSKKEEATNWHKTMNLVNDNSLYQ